MPDKDIETVLRVRAQIENIEKFRRDAAKVKEALGSDVMARALASVDKHLKSVSKLLEDGSKSSKELNRNMRALGQSNSALRSMVQLLKELNREQEKASKRSAAFGQGFAQGAGLGIPIGPDVGRHVGGFVAGRGLRVGAGLAGSVFTGAQGIQRALGGIPGVGGALAGAVGTSFQAAEGALGLREIVQRIAAGGGGIPTGPTGLDFRAQARRAEADALTQRIQELEAQVAREGPVRVPAATDPTSGLSRRRPTASPAAIELDRLRARRARFLSEADRAERIQPLLPGTRFLEQTAAAAPEGVPLQQALQTRLGTSQVLGGRVGTGLGTGPRCPAACSRSLASVSRPPRWPESREGHVSEASLDSLERMRPSNSSGSGSFRRSSVLPSRTASDSASRDPISHASSSGSPWTSRTSPGPES